MAERTAPTLLSVDFLQPLLFLSETFGIDLEQWADAPPGRSLPALVDDRTASLPMVDVIRLYWRSFEELERRCAARDGLQPFSHANAMLMAYALITCPTLAAAIERACLFNRMLVGDAKGASLHRDGDQAAFLMPPRFATRDDAALVDELVGLHTHLGLFSWLIGGALPLTGVRLAYAPPRRDNGLIHSFGCPIRYDYPVNALVFDRQLLDRKIIRSPQELDAIIGYFPYNLILRPSRSDPLADRVRLLIMDMLYRKGTAPTETTAAQILGMSSASLRRRLQEQGASFNRVKAGCRREAAEDLLRDPDMKVADVADRLGFADDRAFRRAFHSWTGQSPSRWRQAERGLSDQTSM